MAATVLLPLAVPGQVSQLATFVALEGSRGDLSFWSRRKGGLVAGVSARAVLS